LSKTASKLRGQEKGSTVVIKIKRVGVDEPMTFSLVRDEITVSDIQYSGFVEPGIGLIKLNTFDRSAEKQVTNAVEELLDQGMESLILDLRSNPGGLLDVAVSVANNFLPKGELVVYTQGRNPENIKEYRTTKNPVFGSLPLVVLINEYSASASEIVAGSIQDLDRGVVIGKQSFGKGLVQTILPIDRTANVKTSLKLTTAKYYLPSGRLIQKMDVFKRGKNSVLWGFQDEESDEDEESDDVDKENEKELFYTRNNRQVVGGGGITPDIEASNEKTTRYVGELIRKSMFFNFSLEYASEHPELADGFKVNDQILNDFFEFVENKEFDYEPAGMEEFKDLEKIAQEEDFYDDMKASLGQMREKFQAVKKREKEKSIDDIKYLLKRELIAKLKGNDDAYATSFERDATLTKAVEVLKDKDEYSRILGLQTARSN
jgi:carboxyl-terminal processing protease